MASRRQNTRRAAGQMKKRTKNNEPATDTLAVLPNELLEHILLGVGSPVDLVRAASVCKRWRRVVADAGFLRRISALHHAQPVAGNYYNSSQLKKPQDKSPPLPSFVSSSSTTTAMIDGRHFSLDFLPDADASRFVWDAMGSRGSLLLLHRVDRNDKYASVDYWDMVVCEPVTRRHVRISPAAAFEGHRICCVFLIDGDGGGGIGISNFKVLCLLDSRVVGVLSWDGSWRTTGIDGTCMVLKEATDAYVYCFTGGRTMAAIDRRSGHVSYFLLPDIEEWDTKGHFDHSLAVTSGHADGRDRFVFTDKDGSVKVFARTHGGHGMELALEQIISATEMTPGRRGDKVRGVRKRLHLCPATWIGGTPMIVVSQGPRLKKKQMCINVETLEVEDVTGRDDFYGERPYTCKLPWPPVLRACTAD